MLFLYCESLIKLLCGDVIYSKSPNPSLVRAYPAAKAGIEAIIRNAADEYGPANIRFNAVRPGFIETEIMEGIPRDSEIFSSYIENTPLGDVGQPNDVAALVKFL